MKPARILVLCLALAAGGLAAYLASRSDQQNPPPPPPPVVQIETVDVLVAGNNLSVGTRLSSRDLRWQVWPAAAASGNFIRRKERPNAIEELSGSFARDSIYADEPVRESKLIKASSGYMAAILPEGMRAVAAEIGPETSAGGFILPNDYVDVIISHRDEHAEKLTGQKTITLATAISNVRVLAIDQNVEERSGARVIVGRTATLAVTPAQAEVFMRAKQMGTVSLVLRSVAEFGSKEQPDQKPGRGPGVNMVQAGTRNVGEPPANAP
jgi:pilus assembly protein CpaB